MKKKILYLLLGLLLISSVMAATCSYTEFVDEDTQYLFGKTSYTIRASSSQQLKYDIDRGTIFLNGGSTSQCQSSGGFSGWTSGTLQPSQSKTFSLTSNQCYKLELEYYDCFECRDGQDDCDDYEYFECVGGEWESQGEVKGECDVECYEGETKCSSYDFLQCDNFEWDNTGKVAGQCNVECTSTSDCSGRDICVDYKCEQDPCEFVTCEDKCQSGVKYFSGTCSSSNGQCNYQTTSCPFGCSGDVCADDPCIGVDTSDICEGGIWSHNGRCSGGNVIYDTKDQCLYGCQNEPVGVLAILSEGGMCRSSPCEGVICKDYCSSTSKFTDGECNNGKCVYSEEIKYAEECGYVPFYKGTSFQIGIGIFLIVALLISFAVWKSRRK